jgi:hypothetical protein
MAVELNQEVVNDAAKLMMHRLVARALARDPSLVDRARVFQARISERFRGHDFVHQWDALLRLPLPQLRLRLTSRDPEMRRLRVSSPFVVGGVDFTDEGLRRRIRRAARKVVARSMERSEHLPTLRA